MTAEEKQFTEAGALATYVNALITGGATAVQVIPLMNKSWYLIIYS